MTATKILPIIANRSITDISLAGNQTYTPQELAIAFNIYVDMINKINDYVKMPPSKNSFCLLLGISTATYNDYLADQDKANIMNIIETYITGAIITSAETGELREISSIFNLKSQHGYVEAQAPIVVKHENEVSISDIQAQLLELKTGKGKVKEAKYTEKTDTSK